MPVSPDAIVGDKGQTHQGPAAIKSWLDEIEPGYVVQ